MKLQPSLLNQVDQRQWNVTRLPSPCNPPRAHFRRVYLEFNKKIKKASGLSHSNGRHAIAPFFQDFDQKPSFMGEFAVASHPSRFSYQYSIWKNSQANNLPTFQSYFLDKNTCLKKTFREFNKHRNFFSIFSYILDLV